ncbi:ABC transporter permease [Rhodococcus sp. C-2]|uniref:ABC transporter permease n=1 Tax=Rhodococcus sp. C-2 TaxID=3018809 RepID=UPI0022EB6AF2|nr:ABC transporter permease [Rhodococcus sp. C-2]MDA3637492.1 ABC transporter permease [Rhodococcus sp. C-2]
MGIWPLFGLGLLLTAPPMAAALAARMWVSWLAVAALVSLSIIGLANWSSYWGLLAFAAPLAVLGLLAATLQRVGPRPGSRHRDSAAAA